MGATLDELSKTYGKDFRMAFRHYPLSFHDQAHMTAQAAVYAQKQGKFWEFHDAIFKNMANLNRATVERVAGEVGLDVAGLQKALDEKTYAQRVDDDFKLGQKVGVEGTPAVFINGRIIEGARPLADFQAQAEKAKAQAEQLRAAGVPAKDLYAKLMEMATSGTLPPVP